MNQAQAVGPACHRIAGKVQSVVVILLWRPTVMTLQVQLQANGVHLIRVITLFHPVIAD